MTNTFKTGDRVYSVEGGTTMTIDYLTKDGKYKCKWHKGHELKEAEFRPEKLHLKTRKLNQSL